STGQLIADACGAVMEVDDRFVELDYGEWDGRALTDVPAESWRAWRRDPGFRPPGGEWLLAVRERVAGAASEYLEAVAGSDGVVVAVSHVSPIKALVCWALGVDDSVTWRMFLPT